MNGKCRFCNKEGNGQSFDDWVRPTFLDHDKLVPGDIICDDCAFWFEERSVLLAQKMGKGKPQIMRNYSHFIVNGEWIPLSKADKVKIAELLTSVPFPELAAIAESGQKHIVFRATRNPPGSKSGWVQFEEQSLFVEPGKLIVILDTVEELYTVFNKTEIGNGSYSPFRVDKFGLERWAKFESMVREWRGSLLFNLALFLAQRRDKYNDGCGTEGEVSRDDIDCIQGNGHRVQDKVSEEHLGTGNECDSGCKVERKSSPVYTQAMFNLEV